MKLGRVAVACLVSLSAFFVGMSTPVLAANVSITGGTNGPDCNSGGYFTPSSVSINSGDTITISVPSNDPYAGGIEVHGFPQGSFTVARGGSVKTDPITANVTYYGTWPSTGCMKGSGTITVKTAPSPPPPTPSPSPTPTPSPQPSPSPTPTPTPTSSTSNPSSSPPSPSPSPTPTPAAASTTTQPTPAPVATDGASQSAQPMETKRITFQKVAGIGGMGLIIIVIIGFLAWRLLLYRRMAAAKLGTKTSSPDSQNTMDQRQNDNNNNYQN